jgi:hypothetical protein
MLTRYLRNAALLPESINSRSAFSTSLRTVTGWLPRELERLAVDVVGSGVQYSTIIIRVRIHLSVES